ncbi:MAG: hypothetical protein R3B84_16095 [Zavarzinella sp.]
MENSDHLIIPVYLNQRVVFDFVASLQGGLAEVTKISETQKVTGETATEASGSFGLSKVLSSLLRIDFSGKASTKAAGESNTTRSEDRIHTPASLFMHLRALLRGKNWLQTDSATLKLNPGDIVEFSARMQPNPLIKTLDTFLEVLDIHSAFTSDSGKFGKGKSPANKTDDLTKMKKQMQAMLSAMKGGTTSDLTTAPLDSKYRCIITLEKQFLNDPSMSDLVDGTFRVVGKVTRAIHGDTEAISLNRNTAIGCLPDSVLGQIATAFEEPEMQALRLPKFEWEIRGPVIQVLPVAIFT